MCGALIGGECSSSVCSACFCSLVAGPAFLGSCLLCSCLPFSSPPRVWAGSGTDSRMLSLGFSSGVAGAGGGACRGIASVASNMGSADGAGVVTGVIDGSFALPYRCCCCSLLHPVRWKPRAALLTCDRVSWLLRALNRKGHRKGNRGVAISHVV